MSKEREREAMKLTKQARDLNLLIGRSSLMLGKVYRRVSYAKLYREAGFASFDDWLAAVGDIGRSQAYLVMDLYTELEATVPAEVIAKLPLNNARDLVKLPESKRKDEETLAAACGQTNAQFRRRIEAVQPGLHLEDLEYIGFKVHASAKTTIEQALERAQEIYDLHTKGMALEFICADWLAGQNIPSEIDCQQAKEKVQ